MRVRYSPFQGELANPERGFFHELTFEGQPLELADAAIETRLVRLIARLDGFRSAELPASYLEALASTFDRARAAGVKVILRFAYNDGPYPNPEADAPLPQVLRHIEQLGSFLADNRDVIAWFEAGFIGAWGEWHSSTNQLDTPENKLRIRDALLAHFPGDRFLLFRYPKDIMSWFPRPLDEAGAFGLTSQARIGHHNDCFLASDDDEGTYWDPDDDANHWEEWQAYLAQLNRFVPMAGETCAPNPPRTECATALAELALLRWTAVNEDWHPQVLESWRNGGCYEEIRQRLGYRLVLQEAEYPGAVAPGGVFRLHLRLKNIGFTAPMLPRPVYLVLAGEGFTGTYLQSVDPRRWEPGEHAFLLSAWFPPDMPLGTYTLSLWLPDPSPRLQQDPRYAIRLANEGVWDAATGWNILGNVTITAVGR
ncbi:MAG: DUF4832 domain-containing protein [Thermoanaerobaculum sp.]